MANDSNSLKSLIVFYCVITISLLLVNANVSLKDITSPIENLLQPIALSGYEAGNGISRNTLGIAQYSSSKAVIDGQNYKIEQLEKSISSLLETESKYYDLQSQLKVLDRKYEYIQSTLYIPSDGSYLIIDVGSDNGVKVGDVVVLGNRYVGLVVQVDSTSAKVMRADSGESVLEVVIRKEKDSKFALKAVAVGRDNQVIIENILNGSKVQNGDLVYVSDKRVGGALLLGTVSGIGGDLASSIISAKVTTDVDLYFNKYVYIRR